MGSWKFASTTLNVLAAPRPARSGGPRFILFQAPGQDGLSAKIFDGREPVHISLSILARGAEQYALLSGLLESGEEDDLEMPVGNDSWVYEKACVYGKPSWEQLKPGLWRTRVEFICPNPRPKLLSTGELVF